MATFISAFALPYVMEAIKILRDKNMLHLKDGVTVGELEDELRVVLHSRSAQDVLAEIMSAINEEQVAIQKEQEVQAELIRRFDALNNRENNG